MMAANDSNPAAETLFVPMAENHRAYRNALGSFTTGVTVVTAMTSDGPIGMTVNSFASVSLDPPLVLWSPAKSSSRHAAFIGAEHFAIHVLGADQDHLSAAFTRGGSGFDGIEVGINEEGAPTLKGTLARFECLQQAQHNAGDHTIIIGRVIRVAHRQGEPLCFSGGRFGRFAV
ncbi:flavin reductase [Rhizobium sp. CRIBSB]|nr:flavin reductase [Rhizobium sp. CRIBSB]